MENVWDFIIIGGGASGLAAAISASSYGDRVLILEKNSSLGKKISASGNGRCNLMNINKPIYYGDKDFAETVLRKIDPQKLEKFWSNLGLLLSEDPEGRIYPCTFQAVSVLDALKVRLKNKTEIRLTTTAKQVLLKNNVFMISTEKETFYARRIMIATGGPAAAKLGGSADGYFFLKSFGHHIIPPSAALCPLCTDTKSISGLAGIRVKCGIRLNDEHGNMKYQNKGEVLFTDYGISGICAMQCARFAAAEDQIELNLADRFFTNREQLINTLLERREHFSELPPDYLLNGILLPRLSYAVIKQSGSDIKRKNVGYFSDEEIRRIADCVMGYRLCVTGTKGLDEAQVTAGGADCSEFDPLTLASKLVPGLFSGGEVLNVDGDCGGYNLMFAFATGILAGVNGRDLKGADL